MTWRRSIEVEMKAARVKWAELERIGQNRVPIVYIEALCLTGNKEEITTQNMCPVT